MKYFSVLGEKVEQLWRQRGYADDHFSDAAWEALEQLPPRQHVSMEQIVNWAVLGESIPDQHDLEENFGQPPLTIYCGRDFRIEVLFWVIGLPGVHQHAFSGAFHVLEGSSLHCVYSFAERRKLTSRLLIGDIDLTKIELLKAGSSRPVRSGREFIHSTFHLDRPSISLVIRTYREHDKLPQYSYLPPSVAYDPEETPPILVRRWQILRMLRVCERYDLLARLFRQLCESRDALGIFFALLKLYPTIGAKSREQLLRMVGETDLELMEALRPALAFSERRDRIMRLRHKINDSELQFFLAVLLYVPNIELLRNVVQDAFPEHDPAELLLQWVKRLSIATDALGELNNDWLTVLRWQLVSESFDELLNRCAKAAKSDKLDAESTLVDVLRHAQDHWMLRPIFVHSTQNETVVSQERT